MGNARNFIISDIVRRWLRASGYDVVFVQNLTDVDDKIIQRANEEGRSSDEVARHYTEVYFRYADQLGIERADHHPKATDYIAQMVEMISELIAGGHAYEVEGDVYFSEKSYEGYGRLSRKKLDEMEQGERVDAAVVARKRSPSDFTLWKRAKPGEPSWPSPWGEGRPGWHSECSVMSRHLLGPTIDLHSGGEDLIFPHHENEIAQSCCITGQEFVRYWLHNGFLIFGDKVSKSTMTEESRRIFMIDYALEKFPPEAIRYFLITAHYRSPLSFSAEAVEEARARCGKIRHACETTRQFLASGTTLMNSLSEREAVSALAAKFRTAMDDDFNTPQALAVVAEAMTHMNTLRAQVDRERAAGEDSGATLELMQTYQLVGDLLEALGLKTFLFDARGAGAGEAGGESRGGAADGGASVGESLRRLIEARGAARATKKWAVADKIRDELGAAGIRLEDGASGTIWKTDGGGAPVASAVAAVVEAAAAAAEAAGAPDIAASLRGGHG
jgi:cysteinyl-tRNA synthetase